MIPRFTAESSVYYNTNVIVPTIRRRTADSSVYDNTNVIVPTIRRGAFRVSVQQSISRDCARYCTDVWINCLDHCADTDNPYPGGPCYASCDLQWDNCISACA